MRQGRTVAQVRGTGHTGIDVPRGHGHALSQSPRFDGRTLSLRAELLVVRGCAEIRDRYVAANRALNVACHVPLYNDERLAVSTGV